MFSKCRHRDGVQRLRQQVAFTRHVIAAAGHRHDRKRQTCGGAPAALPKSSRTTSTALSAEIRRLSAASQNQHARGSLRSGRDPSDRNPALARDTDVRRRFFILPAHFDPADFRRFRQRLVRRSVLKLYPHRKAVGRETPARASTSTKAWDACRIETAASPDGARSCTSTSLQRARRVRRHSCGSMLKLTCVSNTSCLQFLK